MIRNKLKTKALLLSLLMAANGCGQTSEKPAAELVAQNMIVRIAEIEVYPQYMKEYLAFANEVDRLSIEREPGVICLYRSEEHTVWNSSHQR